MANDKMTYNEFFGTMQTNLEGRQRMGQVMETFLDEKYRLTGARAQGLSKKEFIELRKSQMQRMYHVYTELSRGHRIGVMGPRSMLDNTEDAVRNSTGPNGLRNNGVVALDSMDRTMIIELVKLAGKIGFGYQVPDYNIESIINNTEAVKLIADERFGTNLDIGELCQNTTVMEREVHIAENTYGVQSFETWTRYQRPSALEKAFKMILRALNGKEQTLGDKNVPKINEK